MNWSARTTEHRALLTQHIKRNGLLICLQDNYPNSKPIFSERILISQLLLKHCLIKTGQLQS